MIALPPEKDVRRLQTPPPSAVPPLLSVIIPTHNRSALLTDCLLSVKAASETVPVEVIVIDDASTDDTGERLAVVAGAWPLTVLRLTTGQERALARNLGAHVAVGTYLLFLDDDDIVTDVAFQCLTAAAMSRTGLLGAVGRMETFRHDQPTMVAAEPWPSRKGVRKLWLDCVTEPFVAVNRAVVTRHAFLAAGGFDPRLPPQEDYGFALRLPPDGKWAVVPKIVLRHRQHGSQSDLSGARHARKAIQAELAPTLTAHWSAKMRRRQKTVDAVQLIPSLPPAGERRAAVRAICHVVLHDRGTVTSPLVRRKLFLPLIGHLLGVRVRRLARRPGTRRDRPRRLK